ncbi:hypothetical protein [Nocardia wallacei]|uniref:F0F1 ATP synthase subunit B family protein n=1 Tax=Nocardia wallacei TaxID=480035 RepID=UPI002454358F|nr:hypothetical protein [Nocardia wallacei]
MSETGGIYDITWDWPVFLSQLLGFTVIVGVLAKWVAPQLRTMARRAQDAVGSQLEESAQAVDELAAAERAFAQSIADARTEVAAIRREARKDAEQILRSLRETAALEADRVHRQGLLNLAQVRRQLEDDLTHELTNAVIDRAESIVRDHQRSALARSQSIDRFLAVLATQPRSATCPAVRAGNPERSAGRT